ncbi:helical backbone metal receptor [Desulfurobacterium sp.]
MRFFFAVLLIAAASALAAPYQRVVSLSPAITEIIFYTGNGKKLIADTQYCTVPEEAKKKEKIGGIINPNVEKIISMHPDLVIGMNGNPESILRTLKKFGIKVKTFKIEQIEDIAAAIRETGNLLGKNGNSKAQSFLKSYRTVEKALQKCIMGKRVLLIFSVNPFYTTGNQTFLGEIIKDAGAINVAGNGKYRTISPESIIRKKPDIIIFVNPGKTPENSILELSGARIISVNGKYLLKPGPYIIKGIKELEEKACQEK